MKIEVFRKLDNYFLYSSNILKIKRIKKCSERERERERKRNKERKKEQKRKREREREKTLNIEWSRAGSIVLEPFEVHLHCCEF